MLCFEDIYKYNWSWFPSSAFFFISQMSGDPGISAFPDGDNIFNWMGTITGSKDTVYEGMNYKLSLSFPAEYPFKPPKVKFETMCFHPNVDVYGNICLDILQVSLSKPAIFYS